MKLAKEFADPFGRGGLRLHRRADASVERDGSGPTVRPFAPLPIRASGLAG